MSPLVGVAPAVFILSPVLAQAPASVNAAARRAAVNTPTLNVKTLVTSVNEQIGLRPSIAHDTISNRSYSPASLAGAVAFACSPVKREHWLDAGTVQVNCGNMAYTVLTVHGGRSSSRKLM